MDSHSQVLERLRTAFRSGITLPLEFRRTQLTKLLALVKDNEEQIVKALHQDLAKVPDTGVTQTAPPYDHTRVAQPEPEGFTCLPVLIMMQKESFFLLFYSCCNHPTAESSCLVFTQLCCKLF